jgi:hypothetical protein
MQADDMVGRGHKDLLDDSGCRLGLALIIKTKSIQTWIHFPILHLYLPYPPAKAG